MAGDISAWGREIYGDPEVPEGYDLVIVPWDAQVRPIPGSHVEDPLFTNLGGLKAMFAVIQALFAIVTLYQARGNQIAIFGSASFGLTVTPYLLMSLLNVISGIFCPEYPSLFLVDSSILREARKRDGAKLDSTVGVLVEEDEGVLKVDSNAKSIRAVGRSLVFGAPVTTDSDLSSSEKRDHQVGTDSVRSCGDVSVGQSQLSDDDDSRIFPESTDQYLQVALIAPQQDRNSPHLNLAMKDQAGSTQALSIPNITAYIPSCRPYVRDPMATASKVAYNLLGIKSKLHDKDVKSPGWQIMTYTHSLIAPTQPAGITKGSPRNAHFGAIAFGLSFMVGVISIVIIAALSHFERATSTHAQRIWTMTWLCFGCFLGPIYSMYYGEEPFLSTTLPELKRDKKLKIIIDSIKAMAVLVFAAPAIGGLVVVGQMIWAYGNCTDVG
jgi:hypothetical protein